MSPPSAEPLRAYLAGPDIFLPDAPDSVRRKKAVCARHGLVGVSPLDTFHDEPAAWAALPEWRRIALRNEALIRGCDLMIANLTPFRGPSADVGTVYEVAFMRALGRRVFGYATTAARFTRRTADFARTQGGLTAGPARSLRDAEGLLIEQFGLFDNLMIEGGIVASGGVLVVEDVPEERRWTDLSVFEACVRAAVA
ncbi:MAG: nucleoside 2-deoxyribosyltransferase [Acetobacteraceae bacterium]